MSDAQTPSTSWAELHESLAQIDAVEREREFTLTTPEAITIPTDDPTSRRREWDRSGQHHFTLFIAIAGSERLAVVRRAVEDQAAANALQSELRAKVAGRRQVSLPEAVGLMLNEPVFGELRYGGQVIAQNIFVPEDLGLSILVFPYEGGRLTTDSLRLAQWSKAGSGVKLEALVVHRQPEPTPAEASAAGLVTSAGYPRIYGEAMAKPQTVMIAATLVAAYAAAIWAVAAVGPTPGAFDIADLGDDPFNALPEAPTLDELIDLRQRVRSQLEQKK